MQILEFIAIFIIVFAVLRLLVVLSNLLFYRQLTDSANFYDEKVAVLIPARNEEDNIGRIINDLSQQSYANFELLVYDDLSDDNTAQVIIDAQKKHSNIKLLKGVELPLGWGGKNHACYQLAHHTSADILVFLDADVRITKDFLSKVVSHSVTNSLDLLTIFPVQITSTIGEKIVVPIFNWILLTLLPLSLVRKSSWSSFSAANGQCMVFDGDNYRKNQWHKIVKNEIVEDIGIMKAMKKKKCKVETLAGQKEISCRMYHSFKESFNGVSRSAPAFFSNNLLWALFFLSLVLVLPILFVFVNIWYLFYFIVLIVLIRIIVALLGRANVIQIILLHIPQMAVLPFIVMQGFSMRIRKRYHWKNRELNL